MARPLIRRPLLRGVPSTDGDISDDSEATKPMARSWPWLALWWVLYAVCVGGVVLAFTAPEVLSREPWGPTALAFLILLVVGYLVWDLLRRQQKELSAASSRARLLETVFATSREWLWTIGADGRFTFSGPMGRNIVGYESAELIGKHFSQIMEPDDFAEALRTVAGLEGPDSSWSGLVTVCRHRDGSRVLVEVSGRPIHDGQGQICGFEGTTRALEVPAINAVMGEDARAAIEAMLTSRTLLTAFQPIHALDDGAVIGVEALTRFLSADDAGLSPEAWFVEAASLGLDVNLELLALESALSAATALPKNLYVAVNLSPKACLASEVPGILQGCGIPMHRLVLELTEHHAVADYAELSAALAPLRGGGIRLAIDDAGAGFASMRHIVQLKPDLIKLDRKVIAGINQDVGLRALGASMVGFAKEIGAFLIAEGVETEDELAEVRRLGMHAAQGYLLGRPTVSTEEWQRWSGSTTRRNPSTRRSGQPGQPGQYGLPS